MTEDVEEFIKPLRKLGVERLERDHRRSLEVAGFLNSRGVRLLLGTDSAGFDAPGFAVHRELELLVAAGLTPAESLQTGTSNVADYFGPAYRGGRIEVGRSADLVLLDAHPLEDIRNSRKIAGVMVGRWWIDGPARAAILEALRRR
ncbi:MAG TPA: amidohydrolase family protein [Thermoanaerobaculia bacterium]